MAPYLLFIQHQDLFENLGNGAISNKTNWYEGIMKILLNCLIALSTVSIISSLAYASEPLMTVTVCPPSNQWKHRKLIEIVSEKVVLYRRLITFDVENGPRRVRPGLPTHIHLSYRVLSIKNADAFGNAKKVEFYAEDSGGSFVETIVISKDSITYSDGYVLTSRACEANPF